MKRKERIRHVIDELATTRDLKTLLEQERLTVMQLLKMLQTRNGMAQLTSRRVLSHIHGIILAGSYAPSAMNCVLRLVEDEKNPELAFKAALEVLQISGLRRKRGGRGKAKVGKAAKRAVKRPMSEEARRDILLGLKEVLEKRAGLRPLESRGDGCGVDEVRGSGSSGSTALDDRKLATNGHE